MKFSLPKIYPITDSELSGLPIAEQIRQFINGGATLIQIRAKKASGRQLFDDVSAAVQIARETGVAIIVNDRVDIALMAGASGVHLGQEDLPVAAARDILGTEAIIGVSTHNEDQVRKALADGNADYIAFGPVFSTSTKIDHDPVVGLEALASIQRLINSRSPLVAIGGITAASLQSALTAGANSAAMISEFYLPETNISSQFQAILQKALMDNSVEQS